MCLLAMVGGLTLGFSPSNAVWEKKSYGINESTVNDVLVHPQNGQIIFSATSKGVYHSDDGGRSYRQIYYSGGSEKKINFLYIWRGHHDEFYAAGDNGLVVSRDQGAHWQKIYEASEADDRRSISVVRDKDFILLATATGLLKKQVSDNSWQRIAGELGRLPVYGLAADDENFYAHTAASLYRINKNSHDIKKVFSAGLTRDEIDSEYDTEDEGIYSRQVIKDVFVVKRSGGVLLATNNGVNQSLDRGANWQKLTLDNIPLNDITSIVADINPGGATRVLLGTRQGVYQFEDNKWSRIYQGMETGVVLSLDIGADGDIYAATDKGVFVRANTKSMSAPQKKVVIKDIDYETLQNKFVNEPTIHQVQQWAIDYAEVHPEKISKWRRKAGRRAWFPKLTVGADGNKNKTVSDSLWGSYSSGGQHYLGPDDKTFYDNFGWDASLSWDFADLIWSTDQTSIDSRSKMMVELREDILDQITRIYFERRKTQVELVLVELEPLITIEKKMRIEELTALLDSFTDQQFSQWMPPHHKGEGITR